MSHASHSQLNNFPPRRFVERCYRTFLPIALFKDSNIFVSENVTGVKGIRTYDGGYSFKLIYTLCRFAFAQSFLDDYVCNSNMFEWLLYT